MGHGSRSPTAHHGEVLNSGEKFYRIYARNPDVKAHRDIFDRLFGTPTKQVEMTLHGDVELVARLARARQRGRTARHEPAVAAGRRARGRAAPRRAGPRVCAGDY